MTLLRRLVSVTAATFVSASLCACGTLFTGTSDTITINSNPSGALVKVDGVPRGKTPLSMKLKRKSGGSIAELELEGKRQTVPIDTSFNGVSILNILFWPGFIVDLATGGMYTFDQDVFNADFSS